MSLTAGALSQVSVSATGAVLLSGVASGGTGPYTYQWYMSTTSGFTPGAGNLVAGATTAGSNQSFTGLTAATTYFFKVVATDTGNGNATVISSQLSVTTGLALTTTKLKPTQIVHVWEALGNKKAGLDLINVFMTRGTPMRNTIKVFAVAMTDNLKNGQPVNGSAIYEILQTVQTGKTVSDKSARKFAYMIGSASLALTLLNMIQTSPSTKIRI